MGKRHIHWKLKKALDIYVQNGFKDQARCFELAGYSPKSSGPSASKALRYQHVQDYLNGKIEEELNGRAIGPSRVLAEIAAIGFQNPGILFDIKTDTDKDGKVQVETVLKQIHEMPEDVQKLIKEVKADGTIVLHDKLKALQTLAKIYGMEQTTVNLNQPPAAPIVNVEFNSKL